MMAVTLTRREVIRSAQGLILASPLLSLIACDGAERPGIALSGATMGTTYSVQIPHLPPNVQAENLDDEIAVILETVNQQMSTFRPDSELSRFNSAPAGAWIEVSADTQTVATEALRVSRLSGGAFDPTIGPLVDLWGFGPENTSRNIPERARIDDVLQAIGYRNARTKSSPAVLGKSLDGIRIDLSGIAKGFGTDKVAEHLERLAVEYYLVEIGGEVRCRGYSRRGEIWRIGIERPDTAPGIVQRVVRLGGQALATSGDYRTFFTQDGVRYSHLLDIRTGRPVDHGLASVTVIAPSAMQADAFSTALMVLGPEAGMDFARRQKIASYFITKTGNRFVEAVTPEFRQYLVA
ncbi:MAG: FAD:protein FMN transferase [Rhodospirillales bacterium]|nr:FAD:protein FMN transferase [Rhodospirillales bacterium]